MKSKSFTKKLTLNKSTITTLEQSEQKEVKGGYWYTRMNETCKTWHPVCWTQPIAQCAILP